MSWISAYFSRRSKRDLVCLAITDDDKTYRVLSTAFNTLDGRLTVQA